MINQPHSNPGGAHDQQQAPTAFYNEMVDLLRGHNDVDLSKIYQLTMDFVRRYASVYQLGRPIFLVLDNSIIQDFKHRESNAARAVRAYAYIAFCRFVTGWSDLETHLAISPVAVYEHLGRQTAKTPAEAWSATSEVRQLFSSTNLKFHTIRFGSPRELMSALRAVEHDAQFLARYAKKIDVSDWKVDLKAPLGVKIPISIANSAIPDRLPLKYFDSWYVKFTLASRIEQLIIDQSKHNPDAQPIGSGELSEELADLNEFKRGALTGLGDIDLLQICDVARQYKQNNDYILLGQTLDRGLNRVLRLRTVFHQSRSVQGGHPHAAQQIDEMVRFLFSKPFAKEAEREAHVKSRMLDFADALAKACMGARESS
ncbi:hypothetical protein QZM78_22915 [Burkholderia multivorans]|uniref:hypothetical protein n=1 Tax=Burkholderia anthina TaxID=179879 RepID=UPI001589F43C|nr:hypothetical protein [Burkholderia anthina]MDN7746896.1 hypothetical protein [Burkholderia multivorans]